MASNDLLIFSVLTRDKIPMLVWLEDNGYVCHCVDKGNFFLLNVDIGFDPGKAGRAYDIGRALALIESFGDRDAKKRNLKVLRNVLPDAKPRYTWRNGPYAMVRVKVDK